MLEIRIIEDSELPDDQPGMVRIGTTDDGHGIYDCNNSPDVGQVVGTGLRRHSNCPWVYRRRIDKNHKWAGER